MCTFLSVGSSHRVTLRLPQYFAWIDCDFVSSGRKMFTANSRLKSPTVVAIVSKSSQKSSRAPKPSFKAPTAAKSSSICAFRPMWKPCSYPRKLVEEVQPWTLCLAFVSPALCACACRVTVIIWLFGWECKVLYVLRSVNDRLNASSSSNDCAGMVIWRYCGQVSMTGQFQNMMNSDIYSMEGFDLYVIVNAPSQLSDTGTCGCFPVCILIIINASLNVMHLTMACIWIFLHWHSPRSRTFPTPGYQRLN